MPSNRNSELRKQRPGLPDRRGAQLAVDPSAAFKDGLYFDKHFFGRREGFPTTAVFLIREILGESGATTADAETPALESCAFVCESSEILL